MVVYLGVRCDYFREFFFGGFHIIRREVEVFDYQMDMHMLSIVYIEGIPKNLITIVNIITFMRNRGFA